MSGDETMVPRLQSPAATELRCRRRIGMDHLQPDIEQHDSLVRLVEDLTVGVQIREDALALEAQRYGRADMGRKTGEEIVVPVLEIAGTLAAERHHHARERFVG
jgi:hypothetical protein